MDTAVCAPGVAPAHVWSFFSSGMEDRVSEMYRRAVRGTATGSTTAKSFHVMLFLILCGLEIWNEFTSSQSDGKCVSPIPYPSYCRIL